MEETKKIGFFRAFINVGQSMSNVDTSKLESPIEWRDLNKNDFEYAGVSESEQKELGTSLVDVKLAVSKFFGNVKSRAQKVVNKFKETKINNSSNTITKGQIKEQGEQEISGK